MQTVGSITCVILSPYGYPDIKEDEVQVVFYTGALISKKILGHQVVTEYGSETPYYKIYRDTFTEMAKTAKPSPSTGLN